MVFSVLLTTILYALRIFQTYPYTHPSTQVALQQLITPLIKSLGPNHSRLLSLLRKFRPGAEGLALRVLRIFTLDAGKNPSEAGRAPPALVNVVKDVVSERASEWEAAAAKEGGRVWGAEFLVCVVGEMDKVCNHKRANRMPLLYLHFYPHRPTFCTIYPASCLY